MDENTTTISSPPTASNHDNNAKVFTNSSKAREEGELSASENDEFAGSRFPDSTIPPRAPPNKDTSVVEMGRAALTHNPTYPAPALRPSVHSNNRKGTEKYRVPFVISFSDDDSGSDSEEYEKGNTIESDHMARGVVEDRKLSTSMGNSQMVQPTVKSNAKIPRKLSTSRTFISSMNRVNGTSSKNGGSTSIGLKSHHKKSNAPGKTKVGQNVHINSSKLQDLRQLIAIRESELRNRAGKLDASSSLKDSTNMNSKSTAVRSKDSAERVLVEPKEPEKKRLKVSEPPTNALISVGQLDRPPAESTLAAEISAQVSDGLKGRYDGGYCDKEILVGTGQSRAMQQTKKEKNHDMPSMNLPSGTSMIRNSRRHNRITNLVEPSVPLPANTANTSPHRQGRLNTSSFWNHFGASNIPGTSEMDIKSLLEIEELQDKELDEAQEHRRKCEIEERNALKAYRKAQRALAEANARCSYLYHKRELFSANLRSHVMEGSSMFWSNMPHEQTGANVNSITNMSENNVHLVPNPYHQLQNEFRLQDQDQHQYVRSNDDLRDDVKNLVSESCGEPDTSTSEPQEEEEKTNDESSSLHENNALAEDEQTSAFELKAGGSSLDSHEEGACSERTKEVNHGTVALDPTEDSLLLEATLRSQLFARLGIRTSKKTESGQSMEPAVEREDGEIMEGAGNIPLSETDKDPLDDFGDIRSEKGISEHPVGIKDQCDVEKFSVNYGSCLAEPILRSAFRHINTAVMNSMQSHLKTPQIHNNNIHNEKKLVDGVCGDRPTDLVSKSSKCSLLDMVSEVGSYSNTLAINPFWPLCMFELRGKCNDDECPWQHIRDYASRSFDRNSNDSVLGSSSQSRIGATNSSKCLGSLSVAPPTYLVCLDNLKADSHPYKYLLAQTVEQRWHKCFSASLVVSSSFLADLYSDEPFLHGPETRIEVHGGWNRQSSYFHHNNVKEGMPEQHADDTYQPLEIALLNLSREVNKQKGRREALIVLSRALEKHPTSVLLWIVYLLIYYSNQKSIGKDDMYHYAIYHNESSYELWLMFINSRDKLNDRLRAYNKALSALCRHASTAPDRDPEVVSGCILDLFLQMMNCLCSSGEVDDAIQKVYELLPSTNKSSDLHAPFLPDIHTCLTISDKCVLWICCSYLVLYKKLPDTIVQQFDCQKELAAIEWPSVHLTFDDSQKAVTLMEVASESLAMYIDGRSSQTKKTLKAAQFFALNHFRCTAVLEGFDCSKNLLKKYIQVYPLCLELVLLSIRANESDSTDATYAAFEEALSNWVGKPGVQCIWNQYAQYALQTGRTDFAKDLLEQWFRSIQYPKGKILNISAWISSLSGTDIVFGLLNLSQHKQLQNEHTEARIAIEQVLEVASSEDYNHCVREHATFLLKNGSGLGEAPLHSFLNMMNRYLMDLRAPSPPEPLSRSFIKSITKPKVQKLVNNLLSPISSDFSLLNLVLESCFGPSLAPPQASEKLADDVDFAEALMEMRPSNYRLALSLCKKQSGANASISFWASMLLVDSLFQAVPVAPESVWLEAAGMLKNLLAYFQSVLERFHRRALSVYPCSMGLWKSYLALYAANTEEANLVIKMAREEKGIKL